MEFTILIASDPGDWERATPEERQGYFDAHDAFERAVAAHGRKVSGAALGDASTARTVRHDASGGVVVTDGPFVELTEQVAGFYLVDVTDLDAAVAAASLLPASYTVEVRPVVDVDGYEPPSD